MEAIKKHAIEEVVLKVFQYVRDSVEVFVSVEDDGISVMHMKTAKAPQPVDIANAVIEWGMDNNSNVIVCNQAEVEWWYGKDNRVYVRTSIPFMRRP